MHIHAGTESTRAIADLRSIIRRFNLTFTVGDYVVLRTDDGEVETVLIAPPWIADGRVVAQFRGLSGLHSIEDDRVRHLSPLPAA